MLEQTAVPTDSGIEPFGPTFTKICPIFRGRHPRCRFTSRELKDGKSLPAARKTRIVQASDMMRIFAKERNSIKSDFSSTPEPRGSKKPFCPSMEMLFENEDKPKQSNLGLSAASTFVKGDWKMLGSDDSFRDMEGYGRARKRTFNDTDFGFQSVEQVCREVSFSKTEENGLRHLEE